MKLSDVLFEEVGKNLHTVNNDPYSYKDYPGIDIETYPVHGGHSAKVTVDLDDSLSAPVRVFKTEEEASAYARRYAEKAHIKLMNISDAVVEQAESRWKHYIDSF